MYLEKKSEFKLPKSHYGPFCLKLMDDFIKHHNLSKDLPVPVPGISTQETLSRIFDIMLHSMGSKKREEAIKDLTEYCSHLPAAVKY